MILILEYQSFLSNQIQIQKPFKNYADFIHLSVFGHHFIGGSTGADHHCGDPDKMTRRNWFFSKNKSTWLTV